MNSKHLLKRGFDKPSTEILLTNIRIDLYAFGNEKKEMMLIFNK